MERTKSPWFVKVAMALTGGELARTIERPCPRCGAALRAGSRYCSSCGVELRWSVKSVKSAEAA